jgi:FMN-dependent NADH-azoreductase
MRVLHIVATPRQQKSNTLRVADAFVESLQTARPDVTVDVVDLYTHGLPAVAGVSIDVKYSLMSGQPIDKEEDESWRQIERLIEQFLLADVYLVSAPMWNFSIPYALKYYIDCIVQPGYVFRYNEAGQPVPLVLGKRMVCATSRGGDYSASSPMQSYDFQEPYLRAIFGFIGITDMHFINTQPMDMTPAMRKAALEGSITDAGHLATDTARSFPGAGGGTKIPRQLQPQPSERATQHSGRG